MIKNQGYISIFHQPGQGKARLRPSSTSYRLARQLTPTNALPSGPSRSPPPLLLHRLRTLRPGILLPLQLRQKTPKLISIASPGGPTAAVRILLNPKPFHIRCALPGHILKTVIHTSLVQLLRRSISLQMLHLRPDPRPYIRKRITGNTTTGSPQPRKIKLPCTGIPPN